MNKPFLLTLAVAGVVGAGFAAKNDPAVMRIAGRDVPRSEFEYLFNKNAGQQLEQQSLEDYAELFKIYKLKVALKSILTLRPHSRRNISDMRVSWHNLI